jgi:hypothetical protein
MGRILVWTLMRRQCSTVWMHRWVLMLHISVFFCFSVCESNLSNSTVRPSFFYPFNYYSIYSFLLLVSYIIIFIDQVILLPVTAPNVEYTYTQNTSLQPFINKGHNSPNINETFMLPFNITSSKQWHVRLRISSVQQTLVHIFCPPSFPFHSDIFMQ